MSASQIFEQLAGQVNEEMVRKVNCTFRFDIANSDGKKSYYVDLKTPPGSITPGKEAKADCVIGMKEPEFLSLVVGTLNPQQAFMQGKLKLQGNIMLAQKLQVLFDQERKAAGGSAPAAPAKAAPAKSAPAASKSAAPAKSAPAASKSGSGGFAATPIFAELSKRSSPELVKKVNATYRFDLANDAGAKKSWVVDLKNGAGSVGESSAKAECVIAMKDSDFVALFSGRLNPQQAFMQGKLKIQGNMMLAQKLSLITPQQARL